MEQCESRIARMEARIKELDGLFMQPENASDMTLVTEYTQLKQDLDRENELWMTLSERVEELSQA